MEPLSPFDRPLLQRRIVPHRSLARAHFRVMLLVVGLVGLLTSLPFYLLGAWPVVGFMGLDVLLVYLAFQASYRSARAYEDICVTPLDLTVARVSARGRRAEWRFNPIWVRLHRDRHEDWGLQTLSLVSRGRALAIASFLGPDEKEVLANELSHALAAARRGPSFE